MNIQPFRATIPQTALDDLQGRLARTRWPHELPGMGWQYGVPSSYVRRLSITGVTVMIGVSGKQN